jgi:hypothetical protein
LENEMPTPSKVTRPNDQPASSSDRTPLPSRSDQKPPASKPDKKPGTVVRIVAWSAGIFLGVVVVVGVGIGLSAAVQAYHRAEQRANAENLVRLTSIEIRRADQQALVARAGVATAKAHAESQYQGAIGVRRAQDVIKKGLTPSYLQYEAIQAQKAVATSGRNNTLIYLPSGNGGVPLVQDPQTVNRLKP